MPKRPEFYFDPEKLSMREPNINSAAHVEAIAHFLLASEHLVPEMLAELRGVAPLYTPRVGRTLWGWWPQDVWWHNLSENTDLECAQFRSVILKWAQRYHLDEESTGTVLYLHIAIHAIHVYVERVIWNEDLPGEFFMANARIPEEVQGFTEGKFRLRLQSALLKGERSNVPFTMVDGLTFTPALPRQFFERELPFVFAPTFQEVRTCTDITNRQLLDIDEIMAAAFSDDAPINRPRPAAFDPQRDSWDDFEAAMDTLYEQYKVAYKNRMYEWRKQRKFESKQSKPKKVHFEWFVLYQILGLDYEEIAQRLYDETDGSKEPASTDTIRKQIPSIATILGITLRAS